MRLISIILTTSNSVCYMAEVGIAKIVRLYLWPSKRIWMHAPLEKFEILLGTLRFILGHLSHILSYQLR